jgi:hypothetical protein
MLPRDAIETLLVEPSPKDVKGRALQPVLLNPISGAREYIVAVVVKAKNKGTIHLERLLGELPYHLLASRPA